MGKHTVSRLDVIHKCGVWISRKPHIVSLLARPSVVEMIPQYEMSGEGYRDDWKRGYCQLESQYTSLALKQRSHGSQGVVKKEKFTLALITPHFD